MQDIVVVEEMAGASRSKVTARSVLASNAGGGDAVGAGVKLTVGPSVTGVCAPGSK